jgi:signal transduction histidine kinase/CheY-like chemotaxis protein/CHASE3 domain sensor protein
MSHSPDLSIGQRLAIGFGAVLVVMAIALSLVLQWNRDSARAETEYAERIVPIVDGAHELEARIYRAALNLRIYVLTPSVGALETFRASVGAARAALEALAAQPKEPDSAALFDRVAEGTERYLARAEDSIREGAELSAADELALRELREALLSDAGAFIALQDTNAAAALEEIAGVRARTSASLFAMAVAVAAILALVALLTTRAVSGPTRALLGVARALTAGDWRPALSLAPESARPATLPVRNELAQLESAFGNAAAAIERREARLRADTCVAQAVGATLDRDRLCREGLDHIVAHLGAEIGVVYTVRGARLEPVAHHALTDHLASLEIGSGIPGQAARERRAVVVDDIPAEAGFAVRFGYDQAPPRAIAAVPLLFSDAVLGVLVVGSLRELSADALAFLEASAAQLGIGLRNIAAHEETQRLLGEVRERREQIQAQNEELQAQNEEIQAQSEELQAQHEEMQAQNEELLQQGEELRRYVAQLAEADANRNRFLGVLAHELRNPITPIANSIHILKRSAPGSDGAQRAQAVIERQVSHLVRLIDDLFDITRISEGKIRVQKQQLDLVEMVRSSVEDHRSVFEKHGIRVNLDLPDESVFVEGDPTRLSQVVGNLLNNAIKFGEGGMTEVSLRVDHAGGDAVLRVVDDGVGMESELLPHLFQPFSQGISGLARVRGGLGLGLALVKALVTLHDGKVAAHSDGPGRGAEFTVRLPVAKGMGTLPRQASEAGLPVSAPRRSPRRSPRRVLIIEDNVDAALSLREALELDGYEVAIAHSGPEGVERAAEFAPEVVLCDIGLPGLDGYQVARRLRSEAGTRSVVLIALSGYGSPADKEQARLAGFDLHLAKPLKVPTFAQVVEELTRA